MFNFFLDKLNDEEIEYLVSNTVFCKEEILYLFDRFVYLDKYKAGHLTYAEFEMIPEFSSNPLKTLILNYIEENVLEYEKMNFAYFLDFMRIFHIKTEQTKRINFLFSLFDLNKDHKLCYGVLKEIQRLLGLPENKEEIEEVLKLYDLGQKGYLDVFDFTRMYNEDSYFDNLMVINFKNNIPKTERRATLWDIFWNTSND